MKKEEIVIDGIIYVPKEEKIEIIWQRFIDEWRGDYKNDMGIKIKNNLLHIHIPNCNHEWSFSAFKFIKDFTDKFPKCWFNHDESYNASKLQNHYFIIKLIN